MTKQEAIDLLSLYSIDDLGEAKLDTWYHGIDEDMREALSMAIEALKTVNSHCDDCQEFDCYGCEHKDDSVSRKEAIDMLTRSSIYSLSTEDDQAAHTWAIGVLEMLPAK